MCVETGFARYPSSETYAAAAISIPFPEVIHAGFGCVERWWKTVVESGIKEFGQLCEKKFAKVV